MSTGDSVGEIEKCETYTGQKVLLMRKALGACLTSKSYAVVTGGSYARGEASDQSDLDYFIICDSKAALKQARRDLPKIRKALKHVVPKAPAVGGPFGALEVIGEMSANIGGTKDSNQKITRRILFLMEGEWLYNQARFRDYQEKIIGAYLRSKISDHQFCRFLLNDLIRYYRTICVDFEHKTKEEGKPWGTRNIKLIFSRKLLYFSGILLAAETWQQTYETKRRRIKDLIALTPIQRIQLICGDKARPALKAYGEFLKKMADPSVREMIDGVLDNEKQPHKFRVFKNEGHHFSWMLVKLLRETYDTSHPIHNALVV